MSLIDILRFAIEQQASDLVLVSDQVPMIKHQGEYKHISIPVLSKTELVRGVSSLLPKEEQQVLESLASTSLVKRWVVRPGGVNPIRVTWQQQPNYVTAVIRLLMPICYQDSQSLDALLLRHAKKAGLIIVSGCAGSGRSRSITRLLRSINKRAAQYLYTVESVVEHKHPSDRSTINQMSWGVNEKQQLFLVNQADILNPNVIYIDEVSTLQLLEAALSHVLAGRLVIMTLKAPDIIAGLDYLMSLMAYHHDSLQKILATHLSLWVSQWLDYTDSKSTLQYAYCEMSKENRDALEANNFRDIFIHESVDQEHKDTLSLEKKEGADG